MKATSPPKADPLLASDHEELCRRCGECCRGKSLLEDGTVLVHTAYCTHLDPATKLCLIYQDRLSENPECTPITAANIPYLYWLPDSCGYRNPGQLPEDED